MPSLTINDTEIERVNTLNFLGIIPDENVSWKPHISILYNEISKYSGILNRLKHYLPMYIMRMLYCSFVNSHILYGILVWGYGCHRLREDTETYYPNNPCRPHTDTLCCKRVRMYLPKMVNSIPIPLLQKIATHSLQGFSANITKYFIYRYSDICSIANCYIFRRRWHAHNARTFIWYSNIVECMPRQLWCWYIISFCVFIL